MSIRYYFSFLFVLLLIRCTLSSSITLEYYNTLEEQLFDSLIIEHKYAYDTLSVWLISQGCSTDSELVSFKKSITSIIDRIDTEVDRDDDADDIAEDIFEWMHGNLLKNFKKDAKISDILKGDYNLISANAIYYHVCNYYRIPIYLYYNPYYVVTKIKIKNGFIEIDILDSDDGFDDDRDKEKYVRYLLVNDIIDHSELNEKGIDNTYDSYFSDYTALGAYDLASFIYYKKCYNDILISNYESALQNIEKAIVISPQNETYIFNYKFYLTFYIDQCNSYDEYLSHFKNSLQLLSTDPFYSSIASPIASGIVYDIIENHRDYSKALDLILEFKTSYINESFIKELNKLEEDVEVNWIYNLQSNGNLKLAYEKASDLYNINNSLERYRELYVKISTDYCKTLILREKNYSHAEQIMSKVLPLNDKYPIIKDTYVMVLLSPFQLEYRFIEKNNEQAIQLAHKAFEFDSTHYLAQKAISDTYHEKAMYYVRKNNLREAHRILVKGLKLIPRDRLLTEDLKQVEEKL